MQYKLRGFAWYAYPDQFGDGASAPGHPFANASGGVTAPEEIIYFKRIKTADPGLKNELREPGFLVLTSSRHHPRLCKGWESEPALVTDKFQTSDGKVKLIRIIEVQHRHAGDLAEIELKVEHSEPAMAGEKKA